MVNRVVTAATLIMQIARPLKVAPLTIIVIIIQKVIIEIITNA